MLNIGFVSLAKFVLISGKTCSYLFIIYYVDNVVLGKLFDDFIAYCSLHLMKLFLLILI